MDEMIELYGAITIATILIQQIEDDVEKNKNVPGMDLFINKLKELVNQMNLEVAEYYNGALTNLYKAIVESDEEE